MSIPLTTTRSSSPAGLGAFTRNALFRKVFVTPAFNRPPCGPTQNGSSLSPDLARVTNFVDSNSGLLDIQRVEQPIQIVLRVVQVEADAHRSSTCRGANAYGPQPLGSVGDRYRHNGRILLGQTEFCARPIGQPDGMRLDRGTVEGRQPRQRQSGAQRPEPGGGGIEPPRAVG